MNGLLSIEKVHGSAGEEGSYGVKFCVCFKIHSGQGRCGENDAGKDVGIKSCA